MQWVAKIAGEEYTLREWVMALPSAQFSITLEDGEFLLRSTHFEEITDPEVARKTAQGILDSVNGMSRLRLSCEVPSEIVHLMRLADG